MMYGLVTQLGVLAHLTLIDMNVPVATWEDANAQTGMSTNVLCVAMRRKTVDMVRFHCT